MPTTAYVAFATFASENRAGGTNAWTNASNAAADDGSYATCSLAGTAQDTHNLKCTGLAALDALLPPAVGSIDSLDVSFQYDCSIDGTTTEGAPETSKFNVKLVKGGVVSGNARSLTVGSAISTIDAVGTISGTLAQFNVTFTRAELIAADSGCALSFDNDDWDSLALRIDYVFVRATYTEAPATGHTRMTLLHVGVLNALASLVRLFSPKPSPRLKAA